MENTNTASDNKPKNQKTILVVDDSDTMLEHIKALLESEYNIVTKSDGQQALDYLVQGNRPDLILTDMEMPNMNGRVFVRKVNSDPRYGQIPIIFVTSVNSDMIINSFKAMGIVDFIIKPFEPKELVGRVHDMFSFM